MRMPLVDTPKGPHGGPKRRTRALPGVALALALTISIGIPRPFAYPRADRALAWRATPIALPPVGGQRRAASRDGVGDAGAARPWVRGVARPKPRLARLTRDDPEDRGPIVGVGAVAVALMGASAGRGARTAMGRACFPRRFGPARRPQRRCPPPYRWGRWRSAGSGCAVGGYGAVRATAPARGRGGPSVPPWRPHAAAALAWPVVGGCSRRRARSTAWSRRCRPDRDGPESGLALGTAGAPGADHAGLVGQLGADGVPARGGRDSRQAVRPSGSQSSPQDRTLSTVITHEPGYFVTDSK
jgi:hypothetical protein